MSKNVNSPSNPHSDRHAAWRNFRQPSCCVCCVPCCDAHHIYVVPIPILNNINILYMLFTFGWIYALRVTQRQAAEISLPTTVCGNGHEGCPSTVCTIRPSAAFAGQREMRALSSIMGARIFACRRKQFLVVDVELCSPGS